MSVICNITLIAECITKKAIAPDRAATSFSFFAIPIETPIAKMRGRFAKMILPHPFNTINNECSKVPSPKTPCKPYASIIVAFVKDPPNPSNKPATGNTAIGNINERPTL